MNAMIRNRSLRSYIKASIKDTVVRDLINEGFEINPLGPGHDKEMYLLVPYGKLFRFNADKSSYQGVFINFMDPKYLSVKIEAANLPAEMESIYGDTLIYSQLWPQNAKSWYEYVRSPDIFDSFFGGFGYFSCKRFFAVRERDADRMISEIRTYLYEITDALCFDRLGPHIRKCSFSGAMRETAATRAASDKALFLRPNS